MNNKSSGMCNLIDQNGIKLSILNVANSDINFNTYTSPKGLKDLRIEICKFLTNRWNYDVDYKNTIITSGSQQSISLITNALLNEGDTVLIEQPTYFGALDCFKKRNINLVGVEIAEKGLDLDDFEKKVKMHSPKLIYVTPTFNNPTGYAWDNKFRKRFLKIANKYNLLVLEDDPYSLINFSNYSYKSLYELNNGKNVIYLGTFSKYISPAINVGYILCEKMFVDKLYAFKESFDLCTSLFVQYVVLDYLKNNDLINKIKEKLIIYKKLLKVAQKDIIQEYDKNILSISKIKGGLFFSVKFKQEINNPEFMDLNKFYILGNHNNEIRVNICSYLK